VRVDVVEREPRGQHQHLCVVEELGDLLRGALGRLVLGGHPGFCSLLDDLLADRMDPGVERRDGARPGRPCRRLVGELGEELIEGLHERFLTPNGGSSRVG
jgi:hypothetical protein